MAANKRERRAAMWPYLVMPLVVVAAFYALYRVHQRAPAPAAPPADTVTTHPGGG
jgi:hypothetical protein